ncbi:hypothetical protein [Prosthecochloris sp. CIB 2401]|uniref:hypothetical protein n=1 Tax=Prosthecochloris sp. CIB 2401 TaxID=1868325 RepID=UPI00083ABF1F|nr:hypothetical protein [Prosthecochloris sp. CIB 2401]
MKLHLVIGKVIEALQDESFEHHDSIERGATCFATVLGLSEGEIKNRRKDVPVNKGIQFYKRILELGEPFEQKIFVKKAERIDVFPDSRE